MDMNAMQQLEDLPEQDRFTTAAQPQENEAQSELSRSMAKADSMAFDSDDESETQIIRQPEESKKSSEDTLNMSALDKALAAEMGSIILDDDVKQANDKMKVMIGRSDDSKPEVTIDGFGTKSSKLGAVQASLLQTADDANDTTSKDGQFVLFDKSVVNSEAHKIVGQNKFDDMDTE